MEDILDKTEALEKAGGKADLARELFGMLINELPKLKELMNTAYQANNAQDFWDHAHKIHGATAYCGVPALRLSAKNLEDAIKQNKAFADMQQELAELNHSIDQLLEIGDSALNTDWP
ncbi:MAG: Hpt domain-containing protein [Thioalkalispiraceae bacterium]|jgi:two-component system sensor histidine kinase BarA